MLDAISFSYHFKTFFVAPKKGLFKLLKINRRIPETNKDSPCRSLEQRHETFGLKTVLQISYTRAEIQQQQACDVISTRNLKFSPNHHPIENLHPSTPARGYHPTAYSRHRPRSLNRLILSAYTSPTAIPAPRDVTEAGN